MDEAEVLYEEYQDIFDDVEIDLDDLRDYLNEWEEGND